MLLLYACRFLSLDTNTITGVIPATISTMTQLTCVARGTANYLENLDVFKDTLESDADAV